MSETDSLPSATLRGPTLAGQGCRAPGLQFHQRAMETQALQSVGVGFESWPSLPLPFSLQEQDVYLVCDPVVSVFGGTASGNRRDVIRSI